MLREELEELIIARLLNTSMAHTRRTRRQMWTKAFLEALDQMHLEIRSSKYQDGKYVTDIR